MSDLVSTRHPGKSNHVEKQLCCHTCRDLDWIGSRIVGGGHLKVSYLDLSLALQRGCQTCSLIFRGVSAFVNSSSAQMRGLVSDYTSGTLNVTVRPCGVLYVYKEYLRDVTELGVQIEFFRFESMVILGSLQLQLITIDRYGYSSRYLS